MGAAPRPRQRQNGTVPVPGHSSDCFVCGFLGIESQVADGCAWVELVLDARFTGPPGHVHGGVTAALFDELLGAAVLSRTPVAYTATLTLDYRSPWALGTRARMDVRTEWLSERKLDARGELVAADGTLLAEARGLWVVPRSRSFSG